MLALIRKVSTFAPAKRQLQGGNRDAMYRTWRNTFAPQQHSNVCSNNQVCGLQLYSGRSSAQITNSDGGPSTSLTIDYSALSR